jgi:hypothetical protein
VATLPTNPKLLASHPPESAEEIHEEMGRILESGQFRSSKRCREFLRFVVEQTLAGKATELKERTIGVAVFGRDPDYDTNEFATVRVRANEVRRRLEGYYSEPTHQTQLRIELEAGSYVPQFSRIDPPEAARLEGTGVEEPELLPRGRWARIAAVIVAVIGGTALLWWLMPSPAIERFWQPMLAKRKGVLVAMDYSTVYQKDASGEFEAIPEQFVGAGAVRAINDISALLARMGGRCEVRIGGETSFADFKQSPAILMGAFNNRWTPTIAKDFRFSFTTRNGARGIEDRRNPAKFWSRPVRSVTDEDYALISRVSHPDTGNALLAIAGITQYGTQAATEFITSSAAIDRLAAQLPSGWEHRNFQILLHSKVIGGTPSPAAIVATHVW